MRLRISHRISVAFDEPASFLMRSLRISPRTYNGQYVRSWHVEVDRDCRQHRSTDAFGNIVHEFALVGPIARLDILAGGEVEVDDTAGVLRGSLGDRLPKEIYLRETPLTESNAAIRALAAEAAAGGDGSPLGTCHQLMRALHERVEVLPAVESELIGVAAAANGLAAGTATPTALAHLFVTAARCAGIPARFVSGYLQRQAGEDAGSAAHAWAEALVPDLGWVGFDVGADCCPTDRYVRIASALDQAGAAWIRGADRGGGEAKITVGSSIECVGC